MSTHPGLEKTASYLQVHQVPPVRSGASGGPFVTISREAGAGASSLAALLRDRLARRDQSWSVFDGNLIAAMLQAHQLPPGLARFLPEGRVSEIEATIGEIIGLHPNLWELAQKSHEFIRRMAVAGHAILVGRGARFATANLPLGVHVRLVAPADHRARVMAQRHSVPEPEAAEHNRKQDRLRRLYVRTHFNADGPDPTNYDLVINTGRISLPVAADMVAALVAVRTAAAAAPTAGG